MTAVLAVVLAAAGMPDLMSRPAAADDTTQQARIALWRSLYRRPVPTAPGSQGPEALQMAALGAILFAVERLSGAGDRSCASCHRPVRGFTDGLKLAAGRAGPLARNTPTLWNIGVARRLNWDGRETDLAEHARRPVESADEMAGSLVAATRLYEADNGIRQRFAAIFAPPDAVSPTNILAALAAYQRTLISPPTRFDRWFDGDDAALDDQQRRGFTLFVGRARCATCHAGWRFTDDRLHDIGRPASAGRLLEAKTPTLRELASTAPYFHDGSAATLADVVSHYSSGVVLRGALSPNIARDLALDETEIAALVAFLGTLSGAPHAQPDDTTGAHVKGRATDVARP